MMKIEGQNIEINAPAIEVFRFLANMTNIGKLMPEQVSEWKGDETEASCNIKNLGGFGLIYGTNIFPDTINLVSTEKSKIKFDLDAHISSGSSSSCLVYFTFSSDLNSFIASMVQKPLKHLVDTMVLNLKIQFQG